jgi:hypothetical protein
MMEAEFLSKTLVGDVYSEGIPFLNLNRDISCFEVVRGFCQSMQASALI